MEFDKELLLSVNRRDLLKLSSSALAVAALASTGISTHARAQEKSSTSVVPTADKPIRINFNENALGMSPKAQNAARAAVAKSNRYAKTEIEQLHKKLAMVYKVDEKSILLTDGSSEGIRAAIEANATPDTQLVIPELTYGDGELFAGIAGMKVAKVPMGKNWSFDIEGLKTAVKAYSGPSIVYLVNPNNPTATITPADLIEPWIKSKPANTLFIVDEAYAEFVNSPDFRSVTPLIQQGAENIILLKTFSKIHAMAGMRVGYAVSTPTIIARMANKVAGEKLNYCGVCAALVSMDDKPFITYSKQSTNVSRQTMVAVLKELKIDYLPSEGNFIFHHLPVPLAAYKKHMEEAHILIGRAFPPADSWCRVSLGTPEEMLVVAETMRKFRVKGWL
ncbi:aspartate aminotransferase [Chania multitudinisentens RB-25]|uniref:Aspartate aminotransferase n=1 Tax=Chania multitudinisentens RB-25 TaxID=1441930 RepID=W0LF72_9GAMM|nr:histidinol-phosphate transaminase [Chania multitudinisentens]AHG20595.1 aspartate aminotransferase [Chania multitudinisentens RB-25]